MRRRASSLITVLIVMGLALTLAWVLAATGMAHLNVSQRLEASQLALEHAESVIALAIDRLVESDPSFGEVTGSPPLQLSLVAGAEGLLAFDVGQAGLLSIPPSLNNFRSESPRQNGDRLVPAHSIHLVGVGRCRGSRRTVEAVLFVPPFPYAIASEGPVAGERLLVGAMSGAPEEIELDPDQLQPGHITSNSAEERAIDLGQGTTVTGNVRSPGGIVTAPDVVVRGQLQSGAEVAPVPHVRLRDYDPIGRSDLQALSGSRSDPLVDPAPLSGYFRASEDLSVSGDLVLERGVVYVNGDLTVRGSIQGTGLVVATGKVSVSEGAALDPGSRAVLLAGRGASLKGSGRSSSAFQGVVYTEGPFQAEEMSLLGAFVAGPGGSLELEDAAGIQVGEYTEVEFKVPGRNVGKNRSLQIGSSPMMTLEARLVDGVPTGDIQVWPSTFYLGRHPELEPPIRFNYKTNPAAYLSFVQSIILEYEAYWLTLGPDPGPGLGIIRSFLQGSPPLYEVMAIPPDPLPVTGGSNGWVDSSSAAGADTTVSFRLNEFLSLEDRLRVVLWRER